MSGIGTRSGKKLDIHKVAETLRKKDPSNRGQVPTAESEVPSPDSEVTFKPQSANSDSLSSNLPEVTVDLVQIHLSDPVVQQAEETQGATGDSADVGPLDTEPNLTNPSIEPVEQEFQVPTISLSNENTEDSPTQDLEEIPDKLSDNRESEQTPEIASPSQTDGLSEAISKQPLDSEELIRKQKAGTLSQQDFSDYNKAQRENANRVSNDH